MMMMMMMNSFIIAIIINHTHAPGLINNFVTSNLLAEFLTEKPTVLFSFCVINIDFFN